MTRTARKVAHWATILAFVGPFLGFLLVFQYWPLVQMVNDSLYDFSLLNPARRTFVGIENYTWAFTDPDRIQAFQVTFGLAIGTICLILPVSFLLAVYLNGKLPARGIIRTIVFLPVITSAVVIATMWTFLLDANNGLLNSALTALGLPRGLFLTDKVQALPSVIMMTLWQQTGFATVLFLSGLQGIPQELEDAAHVDGATAWQRLRFITVPLLIRTTVFVVVIMTAFALQAFAPALIMTGGGPEGMTNFVAYDIYKLAFILEAPGLASAVSVIFTLIVLAISLLQMRLLRARWNY